MSDWSARSLWLSQRPYEPGPHLTGDENAAHGRGHRPWVGWAGLRLRQLLRTAGFLDRSRRLAYALGYAGHGVGQSYLVGKVVSDLLLDRASDLMDLPMVTKPPIRLPPGLLRSGVLRLSGRALQRADDRGRPSPLARLALRALQ